MLDSKQQFFLDTIHSAADSLLVIINDILDLSKIEAGKLDIESIGFEPRHIVSKVMQTMIHKAEEKGLLFPMPILILLFHQFLLEILIDLLK